MARYNTEHKAHTRQRILETAGRRLKRDGIDGSGVAALMTDAGLTNGAFYAHFESKEDAFLAAFDLGTMQASTKALFEGVLHQVPIVEMLFRATQRSSV